MTPLTADLWSLAAPFLPEERRRSGCAHLWAEYGSRAGYVAGGLAYTVVAKAVDLGLHDGEAREATSLAAVDTWNLLADIQTSASVGVLDPFVGDQLGECLARHGAEAVYWFVRWAADVLAATESTDLVRLARVDLDRLTA